MCFHEAIQFETYDIKVRDKDVIESSKMLSLSISRSHSSIRVCFRLSSLSPSLSVFSPSLYSIPLVLSTFARVYFTVQACRCCYFRRRHYPVPTLESKRQPTLN